MKEVLFREVNIFRSIEIVFTKDKFVPGLYTSLSISTLLFPQGLYKYEVRKENGEPFSSIETSVIKDRQGTIITLEELPTDLNGVVSFQDCNLLEESYFEEWFNKQTE